MSRVRVVIGPPNFVAFGGFVFHFALLGEKTKVKKICQKPRNLIGCQCRVQKGTGSQVEVTLITRQG